MFLSDRDLEYAIDCGKLIFEPRPEKIDVTSIDVHLDAITEAKIWNIKKFLEHESMVGRQRPELRIAHYKLGAFSGDYLISPPTEKEASPDDKVITRGEQVIVRPLGFLLWQTREVGRNERRQECRPHCLC